MGRTGLQPISRRRFLLIASGAALVLAGCGTAQSDQHAATPARSGLKPYTVANAGVAVSYPAYVSSQISDAYEFAVKRPDVLAVLPCYCGCGLTSGHKSNLDCFVAGASAEGSVVFDEHASYCQTCLDIARDARDLLADGKTLREIRAIVDERHGDKGPGTDTAKPA